MKKCNKCNLTKPYSHFHRRPASKDGYRNSCAECTNRSQPTETFVCEGCGESITMSRKQYNKKATDFCKGCWHQETSRRNKLAVGDKNPAWKGGETVHAKGYKYVRDLSKKHGYSFEHRMVMEKILDRELKRSEIVHHIDGERVNNDPQNLFLTSESGHTKAHKSIEALGGFQAYQRGGVVFNPASGLYESKG